MNAFKTRKNKNTVLILSSIVLLTFSFQNCADSGFTAGGFKSLDSGSVISARNPRTVEGFVYSFNSTTGEKVGLEELLSQSFTLFVDFNLNQQGELARFHNGDLNSQGAFVRNDGTKILVSVANESSNSSDFEYPTPPQIKKSVVTIVSTDKLENAKAYVNGNMMTRVKSGSGSIAFIPRSVTSTAGLNSQVYLFSGERTPAELNAVNKFYSLTGDYSLAYIDGSGPNGGGSNGPGPKPIVYNQEMVALMNNRCLSCHTSDNLNARLAQGGPGFIRASFRGEGGVKQMPPTGRLSDNELAIVDRWVASLQ